MKGIRLALTSFSLFLSCAILGLAVLLRVKELVSSTIALGVDCSIGLSILTALVVGARCVHLFRHRPSSATSHARLVAPHNHPSRLESATFVAVKLLMFFWAALACWNLIIATRAPTCLDEPLNSWRNDLRENQWRYGLSCKLHRSLVALLTVMAIVLVAIYFTSRHSHSLSARSKSRPSFSPRDTSSSNPSLCNERKPNPLERETWMQRRYSVSSQRAIYPPRWHQSGHVPTRSKYNIALGSRYSPPTCSVSEGASLDVDDRTCSLHSSLSSGSFVTSRSRRPSIQTQRGRLYSHLERPGSSRQGMVMTPDIILPAVPPLPTPPPPAWSPALSHPPLSADPTIRALSTGSNNKRLSLLQTRASPTLPDSLMATKSSNGLDTINVDQTAAPDGDCKPLARAASSLKGPRRAPAPPILASTQHFRSKSQPTMPASSLAGPSPPPLPRTPQLPPIVPTRAAGHTLTHRDPHQTGSQANQTSGASPLKSALRKTSVSQYRLYQHQHQSQSHQQLPNVAQDGLYVHKPSARTQLQHLQQQQQQQQQQHWYGRSYKPRDPGLQTAAFYSASSYDSVGATRQNSSVRVGYC